MSANRAAGAFVAAPTALAAVAEAAWLSVAAGLLQAFTLHAPVLGIPAFAAFVVAGIAATRGLAGALRRHWPTGVLVLTLGAGAIGWLAAPEVRAILAARGSAGVGDALATHPGGWIAGLALLRGVALARLPLDPRAVGRLLGLGIPGIALAAAVGGMAADPLRAGLLADAQAAAIVFLACGVMALALARLTAVGEGSGFDWRRNPWWVGLLVLLVVGATAVASPLSAVAGPAVQLILGVTITTFIVLGLLVGFDRRTVRILAIAVLVAAALSVVVRLLGDPDTGGPAPQPGPAGPDTVAPAGVELIVAGTGLLLAVALAGILVLARLWMRRGVRTEEDVSETRTIDRGEDRQLPRAQGRLRLGRRLRRRPAPADAATAYRALLEDLESRPAVRREPSETPAEHARRLRAAGRSPLALDLLAADYELVRFGGTTLTPAEERRALRRARELSGRLGRQPAGGRG